MPLIFRTVSVVPAAVPNEKTLSRFGTGFQSYQLIHLSGHWYDSCAMAQGHKGNCRALYTCVENFSQQ